MQSSRRSSSAEQQLSARPADLLIVIAIKVIMPLVPLAFLVWAFNMMMSTEVTGIYNGLIPGNGAITLDLQENDDNLSGEVILLHRQHFPVVEGTMTGDNKMRILLKLPSHDAGPALSNAAASDLKALSAVEREPLICIEATKNQNDLEGQISFNGAENSFTATRASLSTFFGKRWINRCSKYLGIDIRL